MLSNTSFSHKVALVSRLKLCCHMILLENRDALNSCQIRSASRCLRLRAKPTSTLKTEFNNLFVIFLNLYYLI